MSRWVRYENEGPPWAKLTLGAIDGGDIRDISTLLILQSIMESIRDLLGLSETLRPCEYFSLIGGENAGG
jgi:hypothetical protein